MKIFLYVIFIGLALFCAMSCKKGDTPASSSGAGGSTARMAINDNYLYIVTSQQLYTYDISKPSQTVLLNNTSIGWNDEVETIFPYRDKLFIGSRTGMFVFDISDPKSPKQQGQVQHLRSCDPVVADDDYAYVTLRTANIGCGATQENSLNIYDIRGTKILSPSPVGKLELPDPNGLGLSDKYLYVCCGNKGLYVVDVTKAASPSIVKTINTGETFIDVIPYDNVLIAYISRGFVLYDISNQANPVQLSTVNN